MEKPTQAALDAYAAAFPDDDDRAVAKKMFGMPAGFCGTNNQMFMGVFHDGTIYRLPADRLEELKKLDDVGAFEPMPGRPWKDYVHVSSSHDAADTAAWALEALTHTATLPPKKKKKS